MKADLAPASESRTCVSVDERIAYMDGVDWQEHAGHDANGVPVFPSVRTVIAGRPCSHSCGVVRVAIRVLDWPIAQALDATDTQEQSNGSEPNQPNGTGA